METKVIYKNVFYTFLTQIPSQILLFFTGIFITRLLGPEGKGVYAIFAANIELFVLFLGINIAFALSYFIASKKISINKLLGISIFILIIGSVLAFIFICFIPHTPLKSLLIPKGYYSSFFRYYLLISAIMRMGINIFNGFFQGKKMFKRINQIILFNSILNLLLFGGLYLLDIHNVLSSSIEIIFALTLFILFLNLGLWVYFFIRYIGCKPEFAFGFRQDIKPFFSYLSQGYLSVLINFFNYRLDIWIINYYCKNEEVGFYSLAVGLVNMIMIITTSITIVLKPYLTSNTEDIRRFYLKVFSRLNFTVIMLICVVLFAIAHFIIPLLYGVEFSKSVLPLKLLLPGVLFMCLNKIFAIYFVSKGIVKYNLYATIIGLVFTIILDLTLIPEYGIIGAGIASSLAYFSILLYLSYAFYIKCKVPFDNYYIFFRRDISILKNILHAGNKHD